jgi:hypothetical protein
MIKSFIFLFFTCLMLFNPEQMLSQDLSNQREALLVIRRDTIRYDTLPTVAGSVVLLNTHDRRIADTSYTLRPWESTLVLSPELKAAYSKLRIRYRVMPKSFTKEYYHKDIRTVRTIPEQVFTYKKLSGQVKPVSAPFQADKIIQSGSISRGLTIGSNQDAVVNSGMDIQLSGKLSDDINITGAISDKNIPLQAEGTTQKIHDIDRVYLNVYNDQSQITAGDYHIANPSGYFMKVNKKVQGAGVRHHYMPGNGAKAVTSLNGAIAKGRYCVQSFRGEEGNQGPYKITGCNNETYIIMLSGSERVYIDGTLMKRGENNDYVINYNTSEITFTSNRPITKDKRIKVEFEYSLNEYARFTVYNQNTIRTDKGNFWFNLFSEKDSKSQTLAQDLTGDQKKLLYSIGDDLDQAVVPYVDTGNYSNDRILYAKKDTLVNGSSFSIYYYSTDPQKARYKVGFSYAGKNNGNYVPVKSSANGRVYEWVAPEDGTPQGTYSPTQKLITPKKQQLLTFGTHTAITPTSKAFLEVALSNNDLNTFSSRDQKDNAGYALKLALDKNFNFTDTSKTQLKSTISYRGIHQNFNPIQRFKSVEFERDWNLRPTDIRGHEHLLNGELNFYHHQLGTSSFKSEYLEYGSTYSGSRNHLNFNLKQYGFQLFFSGSLLNSSGNQFSTNFLRYRTDLSRQFSGINLGVKNSAENNRWHTDSLMNSSFAFNQWTFYLTNPDTAQIHYFMNYQIRQDKDTRTNTLEPVTLGRDLNLGIEIRSMENQTLKARVTYRKLEIEDTTLTANKPENNLIGRVEHSLSTFNRFLTTSTNFELGSGLEPRKEFTYLKVPDGQGVYTWIDYNENKIKEIDEFEKANFSDRAGYIRVHRPSGEYYKTHTHQWNQIVNLNASKILNDTSIFSRFLAKFSNQTAFSLRRKNGQSNIWQNINPFAYNLEDPAVISHQSNLRNTLSFNKNSPVYTLELIFLQSKNKQLLMNGSNLKTNEKQGLRAVWHLTSTISLENESELGTQSLQSAYFPDKNYRIRSLNESFLLRYSPSSSLRLEIDYGFSDKINRSGTESAIRNKVGGRFHYSKRERFKLEGKISMIHYHYNALEHTPLAYQMLGGFKPGKNGTWSLSFQKNIYKNLDMNFQYSGRVSEKHRAIHTGQIELRASF